MRGVLFDADGVVQRTPKNWLSLLETLVPDGAVVDDFLADVFAAEKPCLTGKKIFRAELDVVLNKWNCNTTSDEAIDIWTMIEPVDSVLELIQQVRSRGTEAGLGTNQQQFRADYMKSELGYIELFDRLFFSCELQFTKPSHRFFDKVSVDWQIPKADILFLDDQPANVQAAKEVGMAAEQFDINNGIESLHHILDKHKVSYSD